VPGGLNLLDCAMTRLRSSGEAAVGVGAWVMKGDGEA
jgi:hypothetical protein